MPENYATTQPFLIAFFAIYAYRFVHALRHAGDGKRVLDGIVIFGTPIVSFLLQTQLVEHFEYGAAISAIAASAVSAAGAVCAQPGDHRERQRSAVAEDELRGLALIFATLAVPLAVDGRMTAAIWAIEGAGVFWLATRQKSLIGQLFGVAMQLLAASAFINGFALVGETRAHALPFANADFVGHAMLALGGLLISWWSHGLLRASDDNAGESASVAESTEAAAKAKTHASNQKLLWQAAHPLLFVAGFGWLVSGVWGEVTRVLPASLTMSSWPGSRSVSWRSPCSPGVHGAAAAGVPPAIRPLSPRHSCWSW